MYRIVPTKKMLSNVLFSFFVIKGEENMNTSDEIYKGNTFLSHCVMEQSKFDSINGISVRINMNTIKQTFLLLSFDNDFSSKGAVIKNKTVIIFIIAKSNIGNSAKAKNKNLFIFLFIND
ncbi:hypothetical protein ACWGOQ_0018595 [Aquimarina sp. M1]